MPESQSDSRMEVDQDPPSFTVKSNASVKKGRGFRQEGGHRGTFKLTLDKPVNERFEVLNNDTAGKAIKSVEGWIILVTGLHEEIKEEDVLDKFADFGDIKNIHVNLDRRTGYAKGYALIEYETLKEAKDAIESADNTELFGKKISCDFAFVRGPEISERRSDRRRK